MTKQEMHKEISYKQVLVAFSVGVISKIVSPYILFISVYYFEKIPKISVLSEAPSSISVIENGHYKWNYSVLELFEVLLVAPIVENIVIPIVFWCFLATKTLIWVPPLIISILAYFAHYKGIYGLGAGFGFFVYSCYYLILLNRWSRSHAYIYTVIAHFSSNLFALGFSLT